MLKRKYACLYIVLLAVAFAFCLTAFLREETLRWVIDEWGPVEDSGVLLYIGLIIALVKYSHLDRPFFLHTVVILTIMTARELDFEKAFTSKNMLNRTFYRPVPAGFSSEQIGAMIAVGVIGLLVLSYFRYFPRLIDSFRKGKAFAISIVVFMVSVPVSIMADGAYRVLHEEWGFPLAMSIKHFLTAFEECLESAFPVMLFLALFQYLADRRAGANGQGGVAAAHASVL